MSQPNQRPNRATRRKYGIPPTPQLKGVRIVEPKLTRTETFEQREIREVEEAIGFHTNMGLNAERRAELYPDQKTTFLDEARHRAVLVRALKLYQAVLQPTPEFTAATAARIRHSLSWDLDSVSAAEASKLVHTCINVFRPWVLEIMAEHEAIKAAVDPAGAPPDPDESKDDGPCYSE